MELTYRQEANYLIPNLTLGEQPTEPLGKYGMLRKKYLKEHRKGTYAGLILNGTLQAHLLEIDQTARAQMEQSMKRMAEAEGVTEALKVTDQMAWVGRMNSIKNRAEEMVLNDLIYI